MTEQIKIEEALRLVSFYQAADGRWHIEDVKNVVFGNVESYIVGDVKGCIRGDVYGVVDGTINGREWQFVETPKDRLRRLIEERDDQELIDAFNQLEDNND